MLAQRLPTILPDMTKDEILETTKIYSVMGLIKPDEGIMTHRPFRSPHHTSSAVALVGGGSPAVVAAGPQPTERAELRAPWLGRAAVACIGPITAATAREAGLPVDVVAKEYTTDGVVAALVEYFARLKPG